MSSREVHLVELVDGAGLATGSMTVSEAHGEPGHLHRAFSVFLRDPSGRVLLQQRAAVKTRFPLRWANTCCGHPLPGEPVTVAAARRLTEELGLPAITLTEVGVFTYRAADPDTGRIEHEYDHVLVGSVTADADVLAVPDEAEVAALRWSGLPELRADLDSPAYAPWLRGATEVLAAGARTAAPDSRDEAADSLDEASGGR